MIKIVIAFLVTNFALGNAVSHAQECASLLERVGVANVVTLNEAHENQIGDANWMLSNPRTVPVWKFHPLYEVGFDDLVAYVNLLEEIAFARYAIVHCEPGSIEQLRALQREASRIKQNSTEEVKYSARNYVEWATHGILLANSVLVEQILLGNFWNLPLTETFLEDVEAELENISYVDWQPGWNETYSNCAECREFWIDVLRP